MNPTEKNAEKSSTHHRKKHWSAGFGNKFVNSAFVKKRVPPRYRPTLYLESLYNLGTGAFFSFLMLSQVVIKTVLHGTSQHLSVIGMAMGGSSLLSPLVPLFGRKISMRSLVVYPNMLVGLMLFATAIPYKGAFLFTTVMAIVLTIRVFPRVGEMNMYRANYPDTHRGSAVGWLKAIAGISGLGITMMGYWWFGLFPDYYWGLYWVTGVFFIGSALCYRRIPNHGKLKLQEGEIPAHPFIAFFQGIKIFLSDKPFVLFQVGFAIAGFANHLAWVYVSEVLTEDVLKPQGVMNLIPSASFRFLSETLQLQQDTIITLIVGFIVALVPAVLIVLSSPIWGRYLDKVNPMMGRSIFNTLQCLAYGFHAYGGFSLKVWPFLVGAILHAIATGGGNINWSTGSLYFATNERVSLYNTIHVALTGIRGLIAPLVGQYLVELPGVSGRVAVFAIASIMSLIGAGLMLYQGLTDPGPRNGR